MQTTYTIHTHHTYTHHADMLHTHHMPNTPMYMHFPVYLTWALHARAMKTCYIHIIYLVHPCKYTSPRTLHTHYMHNTHAHKAQLLFHRCIFLIHKLMLLAFSNGVRSWEMCLTSLVRSSTAVEQTFIEQW